MQDNEPLMRALSNLIVVNSPDLVLFVGEALVGNDAVDQLTKFNQRLADLAQDAATAHTIDGILLTKFDTIDDKVGHALSIGIRQIVSSRRGGTSDVARAEQQTLLTAENRSEGSGSSTAYLQSWAHAQLPTPSLSKLLYFKNSRLKKADAKVSYAGGRSTVHGLHLRRPYHVCGRRADLCGPQASQHQVCRALSAQVERIAVGCKSHVQIRGLMGWSAASYSYK